MVGVDAPIGRVTVQHRVAPLSPSFLDVEIQRSPHGQLLKDTYAVHGINVNAMPNPWFGGGLPPPTMTSRPDNGLARFPRRHSHFGGGGQEQEFPAALISEQLTLLPARYVQLQPQQDLVGAGSSSVEPESEDCEEGECVPGGGGGAGESVRKRVRARPGKKKRDKYKKSLETLSAEEAARLHELRNTCKSGRYDKYFTTMLEYKANSEWHQPRPMEPAEPAPAYIALADCSSLCDGVPIRLSF
eukprot:TRINITY_DN24210_c0_g1_i1.p1 TRINITY_DN24210_c0_g1~~TRINITY_DN24210_c0_g1_i1.p1  ORF type:complete len:244 (+),score=44.34 TRINITY_DN24210_c0_g1_i1:66-797(+)